MLFEPDVPCASLDPCLARQITLEPALNPSGMSIAHITECSAALLEGCVRSASDGLKNKKGRARAE